MIELNKVYESDCIKLIQELPPKYISHVITSPPYNIKRKYNNYDDNKDRNDFIVWQNNILNELEPKLKKNGLILMNFSYGQGDPLLPYSFIQAINDLTTFTIADTIVWVKPNAIPSSTNRLRRLSEFVFVLARKTEVRTYKKYIGKADNVINATNNDRIGRSYNKQPYSTELVLKLLKIYCNKDSVVMDYFAGVGTTLRACCIFGCSWLGGELDWHQVNYFNNKRLPAILHYIDKLKDDYIDILK